MFRSENNLRVRYSETDRMGYVYYGIYAQYLEVARVEALRNLKISYKTMEDNGIMMPVLDYQIKYIKPLHYDDEIRITCIIPEMPTSRIDFKYEIYCMDVLTTIASTTLVFIDIDKGKPCRAPQLVLNALSSHFPL